MAMPEASPAVDSSSWQSRIAAPAPPRGDWRRPRHTSRPASASEVRKPFHPGKGSALSQRCSALRSPVAIAFAPFDTPLAEDVAILRPELALFHLAHDVARQLVDDEHRLGHLEGGELRAGMGDHRRVARRRGVGPTGDHRHHRLAEIGMLDADHRALADAGHLVDHAFDLLGIDVEPAGDDQVLGAADDREVAVGIEAADIAGAEEAVGAELAAGLLRVAPVAAEDVGPAHLDVADRSSGQALAGRIGDADLDP